MGIHNSKVQGKSLGGRAQGSAMPSKATAHESVRNVRTRSPGLANRKPYAPHRTPRPVNEVVVETFAGDEAESEDLPITRRTPAKPMVRRFSELLDPAILDDQQIRSPSGNLLSGSTYALREDRPLSIRERQEIIRQRLNQSKDMTEVRSSKQDFASLFKKVARPGEKKKAQPGAKKSVKSRGKKPQNAGCLGCFSV